MKGRYGDLMLLEKEWWNGDEEKIERVKEYKFRVGEYVGKLVNEFM